MKARTTILPVLLTCGLAACSNSSTTPTTPTTGSTLNVVLTDSPFADARAVLVTFSSVSAHLTGGAFVTVPFSGGASSRTCDLKKLVGAQDVLGTGVLTPGHYTELRLVVSDAAIYFGSASAGTACAPTIAAPPGTSSTVTVPSGEIHLNREFDVTSSGATTITLDFKGDQSITFAGGQYIMNPVISIVSVQ
jgi:Domain of unknown function (DUF4382)